MKNDKLFKLLSAKEKAAFREIQRLYKQIINEFMGELTDIYLTIDKGEEITYADVARFRGIDRLRNTIMAQSEKLGAHNRNVIVKLLEDTYEYSYSWLSYSIEMAGDVILENATPHLPELTMRAKQNPITGIKLDPALERSRAKIVSDINRTIEHGFINGKKYTSIAKDVKNVFEMDLNRALTITRTETHRVREQATHDSAQNADNQGVEMEKEWNNAGDSRVRQTPKANHIKMHGQKRRVNEEFDLGNGIMAQTPGQSGDPANDIHCRCFATYEIVRIKEQTPQEVASSTFDEWLSEKERFK